MTLAPPRPATRLTKHKKKMTRYQAAIKPCPFCGSPAELSAQQPPLSTRTTKPKDYWRIGCLGTIKRCGVYMVDYDIDVPPARLVASWNSRIT